MPEKIYPHSYEDAFAEQASDTAWWTRNGEDFTAPRIEDDMSQLGGSQPGYRTQPVFVRTKADENAEQAVQTGVDFAAIIAFNDLHEQT